MAVAMLASFAVVGWSSPVSASMVSGMRKENPAQKRQMDMRGKVVRSRLRRPKVSMV
jgi:hypothetical protein